MILFLMVFGRCFYSILLRKYNLQCPLLSIEDFRYLYYILSCLISGFSMYIFIFTCEPCTFCYKEHEKNTQMWKIIVTIMLMTIITDISFQVPIILEADSERS